jgi:hypothetical protein
MLTLSSSAVFSSNGGVSLGTNAVLNLLTTSNFQSNGNVVLGTNSNLNLQGTSNLQLISGVCSGRTTNNATITGTGTFNGAPYTVLTCTP